VAGYSGSAVLVQREKPNPGRVWIHVRPDPTGGPVSWSGVFSADAAPSPLEAGEATLELPDGRSGKVIIKRLRPLEGEGSFVGSGELP